MNAGALYRTQRLDRPGQFAFQRALIIHLFAELTDTKFFLVKQFKAHRTAFRQSLLCQTQAQFMHFVGGHFNRAAAIGKAVRDVHLGQLRDNRAAILIGKVAEQCAVVGGFGP